MTPQRLMGFLSAAACISADLAVAHRLDNGSPLALALLLGLSFGQLALLAAWTARGSEPLLVRIVCTLVAISALALLWQTVTYPTWNHWLGAFALYWLTVAALAKVPWFANPRNRRPDGATDRFEPAGQPQRGRWPRRWTVGQLLSLLTICCLMLGMGRHMIVRWHAPTGILICLAAMTGVALATLWTMTNQRTTRWGLGILILTSLVGGWCLHNVMPGPHWFPPVLACFVQSCVIAAGSLLERPETACTRGARDCGPTVQPFA